MMERLLMAKELARLLKVHESTIYRQVKAGRLPIVRIAAGIYRFKWSQVLAALSNANSRPRLRLVRGSQQTNNSPSAEAPRLRLIPGKRQDHAIKAPTGSRRRHASEAVCIPKGSDDFCLSISPATRQFPEPANY